MQWTLAHRAQKMNPSVIREILKVTERPGIISLAGGLPSPKTFPVEVFAEACAKVLKEEGRSALQYASSEGLLALREQVAAMLPWEVDPGQVLITTGSQQGLDLIGKVLIDPGSRILVETPTYLGALQAFAPMEPDVMGVACDEEGPVLQDLQHHLGADTDPTDAPTEPARRRLLQLDLEPEKAFPRFLYLLPNFQNPTGRTMTEARRKAISDMCWALGLPIVEDNPYGDLWFDTPPPDSLTSRHPKGCVYLGSFSKVLAPGLRLGFLVVPPALYPKLLQAKQAADLHTPSFNQRVVAEVLKDGFLDRHVPTIRSLYRSQRDAMLNALESEMRELDVTWNRPDGGMFLWVRLPQGMNAIDLLPHAVEKGVAFVPGAAFFAHAPDPRSLRLSFVTASVDQIRQGVAALAEAVREHRDRG